MQKSIYTIYTFAKINTLRFMRDPLALFFTIVFPLIFLFVFGGLFGSDNDVSFNVALINKADNSFAKNYVQKIKDSGLLKVNEEATTLDQAKEKMNRGELDAAIELPADFGAVKKHQDYPSGQAKVYYTKNSEQAGQTLASIIQAEFKEINTKFVKAPTPFTAVSESTNDRELSQFDYTFAGLLGFSIIGLGIFGPVNVFPELKKQGILRRLSTTPLKVWQYFVSNVISQTIVGLLTMSVLFIVAIAVFHLNIVGNYLELILFLALGIITILGIGLALGGWAKNERQAAPLSNIVVFPMMFLSGTFFPRFLMPEWLQNVSAFLPLTPIIDGIRLIATEGKHFVDLGVQFGIIGVWLVVIYFIAFRVFRWE